MRLSPERILEGRSRDKGVVSGVGSGSLRKGLSAVGSGSGSGVGSGVVPKFLRFPPASN